MAENDNITRTATDIGDGSPAGMQWLTKPSRELRCKVLVRYLSAEPPFCSVGKRWPSERSEKEARSQVPLSFLQQKQQQPKLSTLFKVTLFHALFQGLPPIYAVKSKQKFSVWFNDVIAQLICYKSLQAWILPSKFINVCNSHCWKAKSTHTSQLSVGQMKDSVHVTNQKNH